LVALAAFNSLIEPPEERKSSWTFSISASCFSFWPSVAGWSHFVNVYRNNKEAVVMNWLYLISGVIALALFVYLFVALLKPEKFS
jgi:K+-transporting ATPase KdpF subunit